MPKIVFFNHYHRGDLLTHKEFIRQIKIEHPDFEYEYSHFNHPKLTRDLDIPKTGRPDNLNPKEPFYREEDTLYINTWIGCHWDLFCKYGGINMYSLWHSWDIIFNVINDQFGLDLKLKENKEFYLPSIDYSRFGIANIDAYLAKNTDKTKIILCNGPTKSGQSFNPNMKEQLEIVAPQFKNTHFICTDKFETDVENILFTDDIIADTEVSEHPAPWEDRAINTCDMPEIGYLSTKCEAIVGKNSGPFVFCETKDNYMNPSKKFLSFNSSWGNAFHSNLPGTTESMSYDIDYKCKYKIVMIGWSDDGKNKLDENFLNERDKTIIVNELTELAESL
jgi:hypothetical protein